MSRIGSETDGTRLCLVGKNIQSLKSRLWEGIAPLSAQRWKEQELHCSRYFDFAIQHLSAVVTVFQYLNQPVVRSNLRKTFNLIYEHWESLDKVLNRHRMEKDLEEISVAGLWTMYMASHFEVMTERAHRWVIGHVDALRAPILQALASYEPLVDIRGLPDPLQMKYLDRLHMLLEVSVAADYSIMIPMDGYKEYTAPKRERPGPEALYATDVLRRNAVYVDRVRALSHQFMLRDAQASGDDWSASQTSGESYRQTGMQQIESQEQARREMRGAPVEPLFQEPWITASLSIIEKAAKRDEVEIHGIVVYRLTYGQTETEWTGFIQKLEAHMLDWGEGQTGSSAIKPHLRLEWLDGKELGIPEGDLEAAKRYEVLRGLLKIVESNFTIPGISTRRRSPTHARIKTLNRKSISTYKATPSWSLMPPLMPLTQLPPMVLQHLRLFPVTSLASFLLSMQNSIPRRVSSDRMSPRATMAKCESWEALSGVTCTPC